MDNKEQTPTTETEPKYSITKIGEESPRSGVIRDRWSDFGRQDPLDEFLGKTATIPYAEERPVPNPKQVALDRLRKQLHVKEQDFRKAQEKRTNLFRCFYSLCYLPLLVIFLGSVDISILLFVVIASLTLGWFTFWVNTKIFEYLSRMENQNKEEIDAIKKQIKELEKK